MVTVDEFFGWVLAGVPLFTFGAGGLHFYGLTAIFIITIFKNSMCSI